MKSILSLSDSNKFISQKRESLLKSGATLLVFIFGLWYFSIRILGMGLEFIPGDTGDSRFINYLLEHGHQYLIGNKTSFWNAPFMYPFNNVIAFGDNMLGTLPIYSLFRSFGTQQETAYQLWWLSICTLDFWAAYFVVKRWFHRRDLAFIAAWIFAFTIFNLGQINYLNMSIRFMVPIVLFAGARMVETGKTKHFAFFSFGIVYQFYCVMYTGFFLLYTSLFFVIIYALVLKKYFFFKALFNRKQIKYTIGIILLCLGLMLILILPYYEISSLFGFRKYEKIKWNIPMPISYLYTQEASSAWKYLAENCRPQVEFWWIHHTFPGMIPLLTLLVSPLLCLYWKIKKIEIPQLTLALTICGIIILSLFTRTTNGHSLFVMVAQLPGMNSMRVINRFMHVELFIAILILMSLLRSKSIKWTLVILGIVIIENSFNPTLVIRRDKETIVNRRLNTITTIKEQVKSTMKPLLLLIPKPDFMTRIWMR